MVGVVKRSVYEEALSGHQAYLDSIKSDQRDKAAAFDYSQYRYY